MGHTGLEGQQQGEGPGLEKQAEPSRAPFQADRLLHGRLPTAPLPRQFCLPAGSLCKGAVRDSVLATPPSVPFVPESVVGILSGLRLRLSLELQGQVSG